MLVCAHFFTSYLKKEPEKKYSNSEPVGASKASTLDKYFNDLFVHDKRVFQSLPNDVYGVMGKVSEGDSIRLKFGSNKVELLYLETRDAHVDSLTVKIRCLEVIQ